MRIFTFSPGACFFAFRSLFYGRFFRSLVSVGFISGFINALLSAVFLSAFLSAIINRVAAVRRCALPRTIDVRTGLGAGSLNKRFSRMGTSRHCLPIAFAPSQHNFLTISIFASSIDGAFLCHSIYYTEINKITQKETGIS